ncbi:MAG: hypothetical protein ACRD6N_04880, partial [Pyrinomonadaceae bacterium]
GFAYVYHSEGLSIIDYSYGNVEITPTAIVFIPVREMKVTFRGEQLRVPLRWFPVCIENRSYFVPDEEKEEFADYFGGFHPYNDFNGPCCDFSPFFERQDDSKQIAASQSMLVASVYQPFMKQPIRGQIVSVGRKRFVKDYTLNGELYGSFFEKASLTPVVLNVGKRQGVKRNMLFRLIAVPGYQYLKVTDVGHRGSRGVVVRHLDDDGKETYFESEQRYQEPIKKGFARVRVGMRVTTSPISDN